MRGALARVLRSLSSPPVSEDSQIEARAATSLPSELLWIVVVACYSFVGSLFVGLIGLVRRKANDPAPPGMLEHCSIRQHFS